MLLRFDQFVFDGGGRQLLRQGRPVHLSKKAFDLLELLLAARPRAVSKDELLAALWPDTFVGRTSVAQLVNEVRAALGDEARRSRYLRTVHRYGYAWAGGATTSEAGGPSPAAGSGCRLLWGAAEIPLREGENLLGRAPGSAVHIASSKVSRRHARIVVSGSEARIEDLHSHNGTFIGSRRLDAPAALADGDEIVIGPAVLVFLSGPDASRPTQDD